MRPAIREVTGEHVGRGHFLQVWFSEVGKVLDGEQRRTQPRPKAGTDKDGLGQIEGR